MSEVFPAEVAGKLLDAAAQAGVPAEALFEAAGVDPASALRYEALAALYEAAARLTGDDAFGLHVGERTRPQMYGVLGYAAAHSDTLGEALERLVTLQAVWTNAVSFALRRDGGAMRIVYRPAAGVPADARRQECEQMMAAIVAFARTGTCGESTPREVGFEHKAPADVGEHKRLFGCPILFGSTSTGIRFDAADLGRTLTGADAALGALLHGQAESALAARPGPWLEALHKAVRAGLHERRPVALAAAAAALGLGPRTLQRRLRDRGLSWRAVVDEVRIGVARELLADPRSGLARIAYRVGFSQASAFHRAFRRVTGTTPRCYRLALLAAQERR